MISFEDEGGHEVNEIASDWVGIANKIKCELDEFFLNFSFKGNNDILNSIIFTVKSFREVVTESWHS